MLLPVNGSKYIIMYFNMGQLIYKKKGTKNSDFHHVKPDILPFSYKEMWMTKYGISSTWVMFTTRFNSCTLSFAQYDVEGRAQWTQVVYMLHDFILNDW